MSVSDSDNEEVLLRITRGELRELIAVLREAETLTEALRAKSQDFRIHRIRLEGARSISAPPHTGTLPTLPSPPETPLPSTPRRRDTDRFVELKDLDRLYADINTPKSGG